MDYLKIKNPSTSIENLKIVNWNIFRNLCIDEIAQNEKLSYNLVQKILYSRRLLIDHVESLENCIPQIQNYSDSELFTFCNTALLASATIVQKIITPKSFKFTVIPLSIITSGFCCFYLAKKISDIRIKYIERDLDKLINVIDKYGNCIKRNITYFNDALVKKATDLLDAGQIERAWDCITSIKEVIDILYEATRKLEKNYDLSLKFRDYYYPMENLRESDYFTRNITEYTYKNIKDFYNIFAYVQSQFLHRLAFTIITDSSISFIRHDIPELEIAIKQHVNEENEYFHKLALQIKRKQQIETATFYKQTNYPMKSGPLIVFRESSLNLCACIIGVAEECQKLDAVLQNINTSDANFNSSLKPYHADTQHMLQVANSIRGIEASLSICCDDFNRLLIVYNRFLACKMKNDNYKTDSSDNDNTSTESLTNVNHKNYNNTDDEDEEDNEQDKDDFYAYFCNELTKMGGKSKNEQLPLTTSSSSDIQLIDLDEKLTKKKFKPVLQQLKITINPIREKMIQREREILKAKGIDVDQFLEEDGKNLKICELKNNDTNNGYKINENNIRNDKVFAEEVDSELKLQKSDDKFNEMRKFLAQKEAMDIFGGSLPNKKTISEDILE